MVECEVCGASDYSDRRIHDGASVIRECRRCERFMGFPIWHGHELEVHRLSRRQARGHRNAFAGVSAAT